MTEKLKYPNLLSPIQVGNHLIKNRMITAMSDPYLSGGPENFPSDGTIQHFANKAKTGAGLVVVGGMLRRPIDEHVTTNADILRMREQFPNELNPDHGWHLTSGRTDGWNIVNGGCQNHLSELSEVVHFYGAKTICNLPMMDRAYPGYDVSPGAPREPNYGTGPILLLGGLSAGSKELPRELLEKMLDEFELVCALLKECGFDGIYMHLNYRLMFLGRFLSPITNRRTDEFGGSVENRIRYPIMVADRIKKRCGKDFMIMASFTGREMEGGYTLEDAVEYARLLKGHADIIQIKPGKALDWSSPMGYLKERTPALKEAGVIRNGAPGIPIAVNGGFTDLDDCEEAIASGQTDFISLGRAWICNPDFGIKAYEGRSEDVVPCLRCNACHISSYYKPWVSVCAVNPAWGFEHRIDRMVSPPSGESKKVAVIGGGPAGMEAALIAAERGHDVTLYEKRPTLGGTLTLLENMSFKWPHKDFKNYLIRQIEKSKVKVKLGTEATPELIEAGDFDVTLVAIGADPIVPQIPGVDGKQVLTCKQALADEDSVVGDVVIIGGGEVGVDVGMHFAEKGHKVTVLEMENMLARTAPPVHSYTVMREAWESLENFHGIVNATATGIDKDAVTYTDASGATYTVKADTVVLSVGMKPRHEQAMEFYQGRKAFFIGDCDRAADIQRAMRSAYGMATTI